MASGVPVIGCNRGGVMGLIDHGKTGYLVEPGDTAGYVARVKELLANPALRQQLGENAREEAERWDWEAATSQLRNVQYGLALKNFNIRAREKALSFRERCEKGERARMRRRRGGMASGHARWRVEGGLPPATPSPPPPPSPSPRPFRAPSPPSFSPAVAEPYMQKFVHCW